MANTVATVPMISPTGDSGDIPINQVDAAIKAGAKHAIPMKAPDGSFGYIPQERFADALKAGGIPQTSATPNLNVVQPTPESQPRQGLVNSPILEKLRSMIPGASGQVDVNNYMTQALGSQVGGEALAGLAGMGANAIRARKMAKVVQQVRMLQPGTAMGDAGQAVIDAAPKDFSPKGLRNAVMQYRGSLSGELRPLLEEASKRVQDVSDIFAQLNSKAQGASTDVFQEWRDLTAAAKNATGSTSGPLKPNTLQTAKQVFQQAVYSRDTSPFVQQLAHEAQGALNQRLAQAVPEAVQVLGKQSNVHAALSALKNSYIEPQLLSTATKTGIKIGAGTTIGGIAAGATYEAVKAATK